MNIEEEIKRIDAEMEQHAARMNFLSGAKQAFSMMLNERNGSSIESAPTPEQIKQDTKTAEK